MFLTEIKNVGKPDVEIDVKYSERDRTVRYGLLAISVLSYTEWKSTYFCAPVIYFSFKAPCIAGARSY
jgi:hypothetical protein